MNLKQIDRLRIEMLEAKKAFDMAAQKYALDNCGHKFGDIVEVNTCSHRGKLIKFSSVSIKVDNWKKEYSAILEGSVLKSDGSEGLNRGSRIVSLGDCNE